MPHECTVCGRAFADGSKEMLSGCPNCGGKKFQFRPAGSDDPTESADSDPVDPADSDPANTPAEEAPTTPAETASAAEPDASAKPDSPAESDASDPSTPSDAPERTTDTGWTPLSESGETPAPETGEPSDADAGEPSAVDQTSEDTAQASARSDVVSPDELPDETEGSAAETAEANPDVETLREELNEQFESIRILNPGQYELNLMELYDREEYIISLREDGRYVIEMPEGWGPHDEG